MKLLHRHYKLTTERNRHSQGSGPLGLGPICTGSGYSIMPYYLQPDYQWDTVRVSCSAKNAGVCVLCFPYNHPGCLRLLEDKDCKQRYLSNQLN